MGGSKVRPPSGPFFLDSAAILEGANLSPAECRTSPEVVAEIQPGGASGRRLEQLLAAGLRVDVPDPTALARVEATAAEAGNRSRLSAADRSILALALGSPQGVLLSDDYTVLDVARRLGLQARTVVQRGIDATRDWVARCSGCGRRYEANLAETACPVCGHEVRLRVRRS